MPLSNLLLVDILWLISHTHRRSDEKCAVAYFSSQLADKIVPKSSLYSDVPLLNFLHEEKHSICHPGSFPGFAV
jgi:hypothetical protein